MGNEKIEQNKELVEQLENKLNCYKEAADYEKAVEVCERLVFEFDYFGYRFELPELYNQAGLYSKTIGYVNSWMADKETNSILTMMPSPIIFLGDAYAKQGSYETAVNNYGLVIKLETDIIQNNPNAADIDQRKLTAAIAETKIGKVYYNQKNYSEAHKHFKEALSYAMFIDAMYYIAHMCYFGEGLEKDIDMALMGYENIADCNVSDNKLAYNDSDICVMNADFELGMIYATEINYIDKNKAEKYLKRANSLGYSITMEKIEELLSQISEINNNKTKNNKGSSSGGCYVATCVYGSYDCPEVWTLRRFRDDILSKNFFGRLFIKCYYAISPTVVKLFGGYFWFHKLFKTPLDKLVLKLQKQGVENTPYNDK